MVVIYVHPVLHFSVKTERDLEIIRKFAENKSITNMGTVLKQPLNAAQIELLNSVAHLESDEDLHELKRTLALFFAKLADKEMERLWEDGTINEEVLEQWEHEHMRTPYHPQM